MGRWQLAVLLLAAVAGDITLGTFNFMVDPGRIFSWRQQWVANQIQLSKTNQGATGVDVTFFVSFASGIAQGIFEVTFPEGFDVHGVTGSGTTVSGQVVQVVKSFPSNTDLQITISGVSNPSTAGPYGPFALRTRLSPNGQTLDANLAFGSVYISPTEGALNGLTVAYATGSNTVINTKPNTLLFGLSLARSLWPRDVFKITLASQFTLTSPVCRSMEISGKKNNYNSTLADEHQLNCAVTAKVPGVSQVLYIYGLTSNVDLYLTNDNSAVQLSVSGFTNPDRDYPENLYSWTIETLRFNTHNVLESGTTTGPSTDPGKIVTATWLPTWGRATSTVLRGQTLFMDMTITFADALNSAGGSMSITTTGTAASWGGNSCYIVTSVPATTSCKVATGSVTTISGLEAFAAGTSIVIRHLMSFTATDTNPVITSLQTLSPEGYTIDTGASLAGFSLPANTATNLVTLDVLLQLKDSTSAQNAGQPTTGVQYLKFGLKGITGLIGSDSAVTISCPFAGTGPDDFQFVFQTGWTAGYKTNGVGNYDSDFTSGIVSDIATTGITTTVGSMAIAATGATTYKPGTVSFKASTDISGAHQLVIGFSKVYLPLIVNNPATAYECAVDLVNSTGATSSGIAQFTITTHEFATKEFTYFCSSGHIAGAPVRIMFKPEGVSLLPDSGAKTYYVEIGMPTAIYGNAFYGSGVQDGETYPMDSNIAGSVGMTVTLAGTSIVHKVKGLGLITTTSNNVEIYFPVGKATSATGASISFVSYYTLSSDPRFKYTTHQGSTLVTYVYDTSANSDGGAFQSATSPGLSSTIQNGDRLTTTPTINFQLTLKQSITGDAYFYIVLPKGYSFSSYKDVLSQVSNGSQLSFPWKKYFGSPNLSFTFPGILVKAAKSGAQISGQDSTTVSLRGLNLPIGSDSGTARFVHGAIGGDVTASCAYNYGGTIQLDKGKIKTLAVSPQILYGRGPGSVAITQTIIAVLPHGIDKGGSLKFTLATEWSTTTYTTCSASGLSDIDSTHPVTCSFNTNTFTISGFADFSSTFNTKIIVLLTNLLTPTNTGTADVSKQFFGASGGLKSYTSGGLPIDEFNEADSTYAALSTVLIRPRLTTGKTNYQNSMVYPTNLNIGTTNLYLKVSFPYSLPTGSTISITAPYSLVTTITSLTDRCHLSPFKYLSCSVLANGFALTLGETCNANVPLEIYIQQVLTAPISVAADTVIGYKIVAAWSGVTIIDDENSLSIITPSPAISGKIAFAGTTKSIGFAPTNAYESATYTFNLTSSVEFNSTHSLIILWPMEFDPYLGTAEEQYKSETGNYYVACKCAQLGTTYCRMDNWMLVVNGVSEMDKDTEIDIEVIGVRNPPVGTTGSFVVWHTDKDYNVLAVNSALGTVTTTALPKELDIREVNVAVSRLATTSDYRFRFYLSDTMNLNSELRLAFPPESPLAMLTSQTDFTCATKWLDQSGTSSTQKEDQDWNTNTGCYLNKDTNEVVLPSSATTSTAFTSSMMITVNVTAVPTPQWGLVRTPLSATWDFDDIDDKVWTIYSWWTSQFKVFVYNRGSAAHTISSRPYGMLNAAYVGFLQPLRTFLVNSFDPHTKLNRIMVYPGTQSIDIPITTANSSWPLEAKSMTFSPTVNGNTPDAGGLGFSSVKHNWIMLQDEWKINFRVSAAANMQKGLYYVTWALTEGKQPQVTDGLYSPPPNTLVEVPAYKSKVYSFSVDTIDYVSVGNSSLPVKVYIDNAPQTDVTLTLAVPYPYNETVTVSPDTLLFVPDINSQYFTITVDEDHDFEHLPLGTITIALSGTNMDQYYISPTVSVPIKKVYYPTKGVIVNIGVGSITRTSFTISPSTDQTGVLYYAIRPRGSPISTYEELKALMPNFLYTPDDLADDTTNNADLRTGGMELSDPPESRTWNEFSHSLFTRHMTSYFVYGAIVMRTNKAMPVTIGGLWADSAYQIVAYFDNLKNEKVGNQYLKYVWTLPTADYQPILLNFTLSVPVAQGDVIKNILAKYLGVNPGRLQDQEVTTIYSTSRRRMQTNNDTTPVPTNILGTSFQYALVANRSQDIPTPAYTATFSNERLNDFTKELQSTLGATLTLYTLLPLPTRIAPVWQRPAQVQSYTNSTLIMQFQINIDGQVCCSALPDTSDMVIPDQIIEGYSFNWTAVPKQCADVVGDTLGTLTFPNLDPDMPYIIHCVATDDAPLWPSTMTYTTAYSIPFVTYHSPLTNDLEILPAAGTYLSIFILLFLGVLN